MTSTKLMTLMFTSMLAACGSDGPSTGGGADAPVDTTVADGPTVTIPSWMLEDVQPMSAMVGQTYGLSTFADKIIIVSLLEGF